MYPWLMLSQVIGAFSVQWKQEMEKDLCKQVEKEKKNLCIGEY